MKAVDTGHRVLFMPLDRLIATLMKAKQENRLERQPQQLSYTRVLILDETGYLPMNKEEANQSSESCCLHTLTIQQSDWVKARFRNGLC